MHGTQRRALSPEAQEALRRRVIDAVLTRGRPKERTIAPKQQAKIVRAIQGKCLDQLELPFALWTRKAVVELIKTHTGRRVSAWTAGRSLKDWGFTPQKPARRACERDPVAVQARLDKECPAIQRRAKAHNALILGGDEMGLRSDDTVGRTYSPRRQNQPAVDRNFFEEAHVRYAAGAG